MKAMKSFAYDQQGAMLLEALIAILIFSMGILAIVGLQAASIRLSGDAKYRTDASMLVNKVIGQMWADNHAPANLIAKYDSSGGPTSSGYVAWASDVMAALPGVEGEPANRPTINIAVPAGLTNPNAPSSLVTVTVFWNLPGEKASDRHSATTIAHIR